MVNLTTVAALPNKVNVPDLIYTNDTGQVFLAHNTGTPGNADFSCRGPAHQRRFQSISEDIGLKHFISLWQLPFCIMVMNEGTPYGVPYEILEVVNVRGAWLRAAGRSGLEKCA